MLGTISRNGDAKKDLLLVRGYQSFYGIPLQNNTAGFIDSIKILQAILLKNDIPPERYSGLVNLFFVIPNPHATDEEIEGALVSNYYV